MKCDVFVVADVEGLLNINDKIHFWALDYSVEMMGIKSLPS